jgi:hypothetical protein
VSDIDAAKRAAWRAALTLAKDHRNVAAAVHDRAELAVLRRVVSRLLPDGEAGYWRLVEEELRK